MNRKTYLVVCAMEEEIDGLFGDMKNVERIGDGIYLLEEEENTIYAILGGIGKVSMAFKIGQFLTNFAVDEIINVGVAGSVSASLKPFMTLVASKCAYHDVDATAFGYAKGQMCQMPLYYECDKALVEKALKYDKKNERTGLILSGDTFMTKNNIPSSLFEDYDSPVAVDMESAAVGQCAYMAKLPFLIIRAISDDTNNVSGNKAEYERNLNKASRTAGEIAYYTITGKKR